jgi:hypothetical protein
LGATRAQIRLQESLRLTLALHTRTVRQAHTKDKCPHIHTYSHIPAVSSSPVLAELTLKDSASMSSSLVQGPGLWMLTLKDPGSASYLAMIDIICLGWTHQSLAVPTSVRETSGSGVIIKKPPRGPSVSQCGNNDP